MNHGKWYFRMIESTRVLVTDTLKFIHNGYSMMRKGSNDNSEKSGKVSQMKGGEKLKSERAKLDPIPSICHQASQSYQSSPGFRFPFHYSLFGWRQKTRKKIILIFNCLFGSLSRESRIIIWTNKVWIFFIVSFSFPCVIFS